MSGAMVYKKSIRTRYTTSLFLVLIPILIFSGIIYASNQVSSMQYINVTSLQNFTSATENISTVISRLHYAAQTAFTVENEIVLDAEGRVEVPSEGKLVAALEVLESRISPAVSTVFYIKGDKSLYTSQGKMVYSQYEYQQQQMYDLSSSAMFTKLQNTNAAKLVPLYSKEDRQAFSGLAYMLPFPTNVSSQGVLSFMLSDEVIASEFENYMGELHGKLYLYDSRYTMLYTNKGEAELLPFSQVIKTRGTGVTQLTWDGRKLIVMRVSDSENELHWMMVVPHDVFYASMVGSQRLMLGLILILLLLLGCLLLWIAFINYKPIRDLMNHITGGNRAFDSRNELELIRTHYDKTLDAARELSIHLDEMTPLVAQQFVNKLIFGHIQSEKELQTLNSRAGMDFSRRWSFAMYLTLPRQEGEQMMERAALAAALFRPIDVFSAMGELPAESALCVIVNFDSDAQALPSAVQHYANQLNKHMLEYHVLPGLIGVGSAYDTPLKMNESFAEACAAVQLAPQQQGIWHYSDCDLSGKEHNENFRGLSPMSVSLLSEGIHRGDRVTAVRALNDILQDVSAITTSFFFFRFCCSDLLAIVLRQAESLHLPTTKERVQALVTFNSQAEFIEQATVFIEELCDMVRQRISEDDYRLKKELLDYILENFKRADLSIQTTADELGIRKAQISTLIKEETGQGFVQYISFLRLNEFKRLLLCSNETIQKLVLQIGYGDVSNFLRKFKSIEGMTPGQFRELHGRKV